MYLGYHFFLFSCSGIYYDACFDDIDAFHFQFKNLTTPLLYSFLSALILLFPWEESILISISELKMSPNWLRAYMVITIRIFSTS